MGWYVFALADAAPSRRPGKGLGGPIAVRRIGGAYAIVERRADVPPAEFGTLRRHQEVVQRLAAKVPAILPVRFGTLLDTDALDEALHERDEEIADAFELVRGRVQFTWRRERGARREPRGATRDTGGSASGAEYLRRAARAAKPAPPPSWRIVRATLAPLVAAERYQPGTAAIPESLYHLVERDAALRYSTMGAALRHANAGLTMTGPWPPFAFAPEIL